MRTFVRRAARAAMTGAAPALAAGITLALVGCGTATTSYVKSDTKLGRVVVYRNGVAYFERYADVTGDSLKLHVPTDKVDDFLKSLTVVDAKTGEPAPVSYPSTGTGKTIDMKIGRPTHAGSGPLRLKLSYVTDAPSWKPSYRVVIGDDDKVTLQGWAIVDNTSGEDWKNVRLGVGASSAMSFRFDLKGLRIVKRETLHGDSLFAQAPPTGGAAYGDTGTPGSPRVLADVSDAMLAARDDEAPRQVRGETTSAGVGSRATSAPRMLDTVGGRRAEHRRAMPVGKPKREPPSPPADPIQRMAANLRSNGQRVVVEGYAAPTDGDKMSASLERANRLRDALVRNGVDPKNVVALGKGQQQGRNGGARVVQAPSAQPPKEEQGKQAKASTKPAKAAPADPIGTSHFESPSAMTVASGTSAMVSILRAKTEGEVVYLYDPESARGNARYPFRTVRFRNPTGSALESGPVSVFGQGRFIGEGLADPIPAKSVAFVPFALDRQIVVERKNGEHDDIAKILTVQRGVFSTQIKHTRRATFTLYNRLSEPATVYLRHTVPAGYALTKGPKEEALNAANGETPLRTAERLGGAHLFRVELAPKGKAEVVIEEATPVFRSTDIRTPAGLDLVRAYVSNAALKGPLKEQVKELIALNAEMTKLGEQIKTAHEQMGEYRTRMDELHSQIFTLKAVKTAGPLMTHLEKKLKEMSEKLSKATLDVVALEEKRMVARVRFQNGVGELSLEPKGEAEKATASAE